MTAPAIIQALVNRFRDSRELYRSGRYNEAQLRQEFLNPFFEALGWDMFNRSNFAPQYREVIHEDSLEDEGSLKAPDYAFRIGTTRKFFVEAKKPAVDIRYAIHPAYQLRRYAWNAHLPLSILTDFEELAVYDCRTRPDPKDSAATGRVMLFTFEEYIDHWDELAQIFSKDAVWNGSFDRYAEGTKGKRGTTEVDAEFLKEIEQWRLLLARNIALRNFRPSASAAETPPNLHRAERQLNYAVQTTIDRILFLRICEDRQIEPADQLLQIAEGADIYAHLLVLFQKADQKYNSGLFHFNKEKGQTSEPDTFTPTLQIDDKVLRQIIKSTYYPCPYMFNEIPVEILGQVYEQFLGSVIRLTPAGQAKVEEKPEVRKAGGVYYTPRYIVDYIVQNTLGRLLGEGPIVPASSPSTDPDRQASIPLSNDAAENSASLSDEGKDNSALSGERVRAAGERNSLSNEGLIVPASSPSTDPDRQVSNHVNNEAAGVRNSLSNEGLIVPASSPSTEPDRQVSTPLNNNAAGVSDLSSDEGKNIPALSRERVRAAGERDKLSDEGKNIPALSRERVRAAGERDKLSDNGKSNSARAAGVWGSLSNEGLIVPASSPSTDPDRQVSIPLNNDATGVRDLSSDEDKDDLALSRERVREAGERDTPSDQNMIVPASSPSTDPDRQVSIPLNNDAAGVSDLSSDEGKDNPALSGERVRAAGERDTSSDEDKSNPAHTAGVRATLSSEEGLEASRPERVPGVPTDASGVGVLRNAGTITKSTTLPEPLTPTQALNLRVVDPACGSGSFLLGAYQYLLDWHLHYYLTHDPQSHTRGKNPPLVTAEGGEYRLTTATKKRILTSCIHGVDIDAQAVEVTKLSLLLKLLEGETGQLSLGFERVLPDLDQNIRCGNSLIGWDYFQGQMFPDEEEIQRVNPFDWQRAFPHVFAAGGFDAVIGNPPYIRIQTMATKDIQYFSHTYESAVGNYDIYCPFVEMGIKLINKNGLVSFIVPHRFFKTDYGLGLRKIVTQGNLLQSIIDFDGFMVFNTASINTCVIVLVKLMSPRFYYAKINDVRLSEGEMPDVLSSFLEHWEGRNFRFEAAFLKQDSFSSQPWNFIMPDEQSVWKKLKDIAKNLSDYSFQIFQGLKTGGDLVFSVYSDSSSDKCMRIICPKDMREYLVESELFHPQYKGGDINRYKLTHDKRYVLFPYVNGQLISKADFENHYPLTMKYLLAHKSFLESRENGKMKGNQWYGYTRSQALTSMQQPKLLTPEYYAYPAFCLDSSGDAFFFGGGAGGYAIVPKEIKPEVLLGILNSKLVGWFIKKTSIRQYQTAYSFVKKYIEKIPIKPFENKVDEDNFLRLVLLMLDLQSRQARTPLEKKQLELFKSATDNSIDHMVYELYELTDEEIKIVEGNE